jgi:hypothetical protein
MGSGQLDRQKNFKGGNLMKDAEYLAEDDERAFVYYLEFRTRILDQKKRPLKGKQGVWLDESSIFFTPWNKDSNSIGDLEDQVADNYFQDYCFDLLERLEGIPHEDLILETEIKKIEQLHEGDRWELVWKL